MNKQLLGYVLRLAGVPCAAAIALMLGTTTGNHGSYKLGRLGCDTRLPLFPASYAHSNTWESKSWTINNNQRI